jgi:hypothetical protein
MSAPSSLGVTAYLIAFSMSGWSKERWQLRSDRLGVDPEMRPHPVLETHLLDFQVELQCFDFLRERNLSGRFIGQRISKERRQPRKHRVCPLGLLQQHKRRNRIQRVEQEVRVELVAKHRQLRRRRLAFEPLALVDLLLEQDVIIDPVIERRPGGEQREVQQDGAEIFEPGRPRIGLQEGRITPRLDHREGHRCDYHGDQRQHRRPHDAHLDQPPEQRAHQQGQRIAGGGEERRMDKPHRPHVVGETRQRTEQEVAGPAEALEEPEGAVLVLEEGRVEPDPLEDRASRGINLGSVAPLAPLLVPNPVRSAAG